MTRDGMGINCRIVAVAEVASKIDTLRESRVSGRTKSEDRHSRVE